jgi:hypothetical protein
VEPVKNCSESARIGGTDDDSGKPAGSNFRYKKSEFSFSFLNFRFTLIML